MMKDSPKKAAWMKENTSVSTIRINHNTDKDIIDYFGTKIPASVIKTALREYIKNNPK